MGKIPYLEWDGSTLFESSVIVEYLDEVYPDPPLLPRDSLERARVRELSTLLDVHLELQARRLYRAAFSGADISEETKREVEKELAKGARALRQTAKFAPFIAGPRFTLADCAAVVHLPLVTLATRKIYGADMLEDIAAIKPYLTMCGERPSVKRVTDDRKAAQAKAAEKS